MFEHHPSLVGGGHPQEEPAIDLKSYSFLDFVLTPYFFGAVIVLVIVMVYGAIRVKKAGISFASKSTISSSPTLSATMVHYSYPRVADYFARGVNLITHNAVAKSFTGFWKRVPGRFWNFYISSFTIHRYRPEWGKYKNWSSRAPLRPKERHHKIRPSLIRRHKDKMIDTLVKPMIYHTNYTSELVVPKPTSHNHIGCQRVRINVGGCIYETQARTLSKFPNTLLGDPNKRLRYFNPAKQEYFFDRNRASFEVILHYYQSGGRFKRPDYIPTDIMLDDAKFYGFPQAVIYQFLCDEGLTSTSTYLTEDILPENMLLRKIWLLFDFPQSSTQAQVISLISVGAIVLSITTFCIETLESLSGKKFTMSTTTNEALRNRYDPLDLNDPFFFTETICSAWFILEYFARLASSPVKFQFLISCLNIIDLIAILPYFVQLISSSGNDSSGFRKSASGVSIIRVVRLVRVFRIFKLGRYSRGLKILGMTLHASLNELMLLIFFVLIGVILFSSTMYFAELGTDNTFFPSIPDGFWWALITLTTLGYGDNVPKTTWGKMVGAVCAVAGVLTLALPVPVIVSNFNFFYHQVLSESDLSWIRINHTPPCPFRPMGSLTADDLPLEKDETVNAPPKKQKEETSSKPTVDKNKSTTSSKNKPVEMFSSDEEFGELKSRAKEQDKKKKIKFTN